MKKQTIKTVQLSDDINNRLVKLLKVKNDKKLPGERTFTKQQLVEIAIDDYLKREQDNNE